MLHVRPPTLPPRARRRGRRSLVRDGSRAPATGRLPIVRRVLLASAFHARRRAARGRTRGPSHAAGLRSCGTRVRTLLAGHRWRGGAALLAWDRRRRRRPLGTRSRRLGHAALAPFARGGRGNRARLWPARFAGRHLTPACTLRRCARPRRPTVDRRRRTFRAPTPRPRRGTLVTSAPRRRSRTRSAAGATGAGRSAVLDRRPRPRGSDHTRRRQRAGWRVQTDRPQRCGMVACRPCGHYLPRVDGFRRPSPVMPARDEARRRRPHGRHAAHRRQAAERPRSETNVLAAAASEVVPPDTNDRVVDPRVAEDVHLVGMDDGRALDDHVVDDVRATPPAPPRDPDERARSPPRNARLAPTERHPTDHGRPDTDRHRDPTPTEEGDERGRVHGRNDDRARRPSPHTADGDPATVVIRRPAPRQVVDPGPAVERIPDPPAAAVGRPRGGHRGRDPHRTVLGLVTPAPVAVEVVGTVDLLRDVELLVRVPAEPLLRRAHLGLAER